jgi:prespore-specific regulator
MTSTVLRIDNWKSSEDKHLARTVLSFVREGKTQLQAFEHCAEKIDRSAVACGFRWNKYLRQHYKEELRIARRIRRGQSIKKA